MSNPHKIYLIIVGVLVIGLVGLVWHNGRSQDTAIAKEKAANALLEKQIAGFKQDIAAIRATEKAANDALEVERKKPATVQTVLKYIPLPGPIQVVQVPGQPARIEIGGDPQQNLDALQDFGIECKECKNSLLARNAELDKQALELAAMTAERNNLQTTLNGGTRWAKTKKELKCAGIGGALAAGGAFYKKGLGAFLGAAGGELLCHVMSK